MTTYPIISKVTGDPYIDMIYEFELQIASLFAQIARTDDEATLLRLHARIDDIDDFVGRLCD